MVLCAANERCVFGLTEYVITESVCSLGVPRYFAASRAQLFDINDSSRRESKTVARGAGNAAFGGTRWRTRGEEQQDSDNTHIESVSQRLSC